LSFSVFRVQEIFLASAAVSLLFYKMLFYIRQ